MFTQMINDCPLCNKDLLQSILFDSQSTRDELKLQLALTEDLKNENVCLRKRISQLQGSAKLWGQREALCVRKIVLLSSQNSELKKRIHAMRREMENILRHYNESIIAMKYSVDDHIKQLSNQREKWDVCIVQKDAQLTIARKKCKQLARTRHYLSDFLVDAIVRANRCQGVDIHENPHTQNNSFSRRTSVSDKWNQRTSLFCFEELTCLDVDSMNLDDFKFIFKLLLSRIKSRGEEGTTLSTRDNRRDEC